MSYADYVKDMTLDDLSNLSEALENKRTRLLEEKRMTVWRVSDRWLCYGNYREEDYVKAAKCLARHAEKIYLEGERNRSDLELHIVAERMPLSEYEGWEFDDK
jgi:hypothetical protein